MLYFVFRKYALLTLAGIREQFEIILILLYKSLLL